MHITMNGQILDSQFPPNPSSTAAVCPLRSRVRVKATCLTRPGAQGVVVWTTGNQLVIQFRDKRRLHYWRHEVDPA